MSSVNCQPAPAGVASARDGAGHAAGSRAAPTVARSARRGSVRGGGGRRWVRGWVVLHQDVRWKNGEQVVRGPVEREAGGEIVEDGQKHKRHPAHQFLLCRVQAGRHRRGVRLPDGSGDVEDGQEVYRKSFVGHADKGNKTKSRNGEQRVGLGKVHGPKETCTPQLNGAAQHRKQSKKYRELDQHGDAAGDGVDAVLTIQLAHLLLKLHLVVFVFFLYGGQLWCECGHFLGGTGA